MIAVSGVHSDPDPSPGIGIARSLRDAFPEASLTAVDYSVRSSGLHHPVFDNVLLQPVWAELDLATYASQIRQHLDQPTGCWLSGLDVEAEWLAITIGEHPRLLVPSATAQQVVRKPLLASARSIGMRVPEFLPATAPPTDLHALGRRSGWRLWIKGKYHEAYAVHGFAELRRQVKALEVHWPLEDIFVQQHVSGLERSITFAAYNGRLLDAVEVEKRSVTSQGKTWAAAVTAPPADVRERLASLVAELRWTGGGEVEFVRDETGEDWLIDFNPRFPAYIYGVTLCGHNLPACLVASALGMEFAQRADPAQQFIRVVQELPVRQELPLPRMVRTADGFGSAGKHPSFQPALVRRLRKSEHHGSSIPERSSPVLPEFLTNWQPPPRTPLRFRDFAAAEASMGRLARTLESCSAKPMVIPALSVKTDPHPELARLFLRRGWWAEVISVRELDWARRMGFEASQIVFNGPAVVDLASSVGRPVAVAFADSVEAFEALLESQPSEVIGVRLRSGAVTSRFGVDLTDYQAFNRVAHCLRRHDGGLRLGLHMHFASDVCGPVRWKDLVEHALVWAGALAQASGAAFSVFDIGGGWHPDDFLDLLIPILPALQSRIAGAMPSVDTILLEPGKGVATDTAWLATRVTEVRSRELHDAREVVVDASISDLPMAGLYAHRVLHLRNGRCLGWLTGGSQRILGSTCMETDILAEGVGFPQAPAAGDMLLFSSAGGYNASMAWHFASGVCRDS
jgi:diaminopimelate decarboxylase